MNNAQRAHRVPTLALLAVTAATLVVTPSAHAMDFLGFDPGIRAGAALSRLSLSSTPQGVDNQFQPGFMVGATLSYRRLPFVDLELQALYIEQGGELEGAIEFFGETLEGQAKLRVDYLAFPLLASLHAPGAIVRPYVKAGPQIAFRISADAELDSQSGVTVETDIKDDTNTVDFGAYFAGGLEFPLTTISAFVEIGYGIGFLDVFKEDQNIGEPINAKNQVLAITAGLSY